MKFKLILCRDIKLGWRINSYFALCLFLSKVSRVRYFEHLSNQYAIRLLNTKKGEPIGSPFNLL